MNSPLDRRILIVDDDAEIVDSVRFALERRGYEVLVARNGTEALMRIERDAPGLVILDVVMPQRSGFLVLDRVRQHGSVTPKIVMVTGQTEDRVREFAQSRGVDAFLLKPFDLDELLERIEELLPAPGSED